MGFAEPATDDHGAQHTNAHTHDGEDGKRGGDQVVGGHLPSQLINTRLPGYHVGGWRGGTPAARRTRG